MGMKSALLTDIAVHVSGAIDWRQHGIKERAGVVYFAFERAALTCRRLMAYAKRNGYTDLPIAVCGDLIDLLSPTCVDIMVATIGDAATRFNIPVGLAIIDTTAKGIAAGGGDEDKARDQNRMAANFKRLRERLPNIHLACIGHTGKDEARGERGSNAKLGDIDMAVQLTGSEVKTATIVAANDQPCELLTTFAMEEVDLGVDGDAERITTAILSTRVFSCETRDAATGPKLTKNQQTMFSILFDAGRLTTEQWNEKAREADIGVKRKADLVDIRSALKAKGLIYETTGAWVAKRT
jgi:hypothetical protein